MKMPTGHLYSCIRILRYLYSCTILYQNLNPGQDTRAEPKLEGHRCTILYMRCISAPVAGFCAIEIRMFEASERESLFYIDLLYSNTAFYQQAAR